MAFNGRYESESFAAGADLSDHQFGIVELTSAGLTVNKADAGQGFGVLINKPRSGEAAEVTLSGVVKVRAGASLAAGAHFTSNSLGFAVTANSLGGLSPLRVLGRNIAAAVSSGQVFTAAIRPFSSINSLNTSF